VTDYAGKKPANIVRIGNSAGSQQVAMSTDGGATWSVHRGAGTTQYGGAVAYSADADTILWSPSNSGVLRSQDQGTFTAVGSLPSGAVIAADKRNNTVFYAGGGGAFYRSTDGGSSFSAATEGLGSVNSIRDIAAHPMIAGEVWASTNSGLFRSIDYGVSFAKVAGLNDTQHIALGLGSGSTWNVYALGRGADGAKLYTSADDGASWVDIQGSQGFGALSGCRLAGSANVAGQVYVGTNGRGVLYAQGTVVGGSPTTTLATSTTVRPTSSTSGSATTSRPTPTEDFCEPEPTSSAAPSSISTATTTTSFTTVTRTTSVLASSTRTSSSATTTPAALAQHWGQCGGIGWNGPSQCISPWVCKFSNDWYSQCL